VGNQSLLTMAVSHPQGAKSLMSGRVVILRHGVHQLSTKPLCCSEWTLQHFRSNTAAILLKPAPLQAIDSGRLERVKTYYMLALVDRETKSGEHGD